MLHQTYTVSVVPEAGMSYAAFEVCEESARARIPHTLGAPEKVGDGYLRFKLAANLQT